MTRGLVTDTVAKSTATTRHNAASAQSDFAALTLKNAPPKKAWLPHRSSELQVTVTQTPFCANKCAATATNCAPSARQIPFSGVRPSTRRKSAGLQTTRGRAQHAIIPAFDIGGIIEALRCEKQALSATWARAQQIWRFIKHTHVIEK